MVRPAARAGALHLCARNPVAAHGAACRTQAGQAAARGTRVRTEHAPGRRRPHGDLGRMADVCAELERLAAQEARGC